MDVRTHSRVLLVVGLVVIPFYKDSGDESFYLTSLLHLNCKSVTLKKDPHAAAFINTPLNQFRELQLLRWTDNVNWLGISPSANFQPGPATAYVRGKDELLKDDSGKSVLNSDTLAVALLDELENPTIKQARFTARND
ncbi:Rrf2-linked NADH-flavin reductase [Lacticaseibacillus paracasei]|nr:Rrf2-linked NADH-flavin reductase [Lacticaseibacillus paracasei]